MIEPAARENVTHQAGGGASAAQRAVETIHAVTLPHLKQIYAHHAGDKAVWSKEQAQFFLQNVQKHPVTEAVGSVLAKDTLDFNGFLTYISSSHASVTLEPKKEDLSWPLSAYFISSSHNTYLSGNQLSSDSTTASYTNVLLRGCRCVEIDVWDGDEDSDSDSSNDEGGDQALASKKSKRSSTFGKLKSSLPDSLAARLKKTNLGKKAEEKDAKEGGVAPAPATEKPPVHEKTPEVAVVEPRVLHGYTLTKEISFRDVCVAIRDNGFAVTDTPIIVSLEVHCKPPQQMLMVKIMKEIWSEHLVPEPDHDPVSLPSPGELRNKILVKVKYAPPGSSPPVEDSEDDDRLSGEVSRKGESKKEKPSKITQELSRLGVFTKGISFKSLAQPEASMPTHIFSLSEKKFLDYHEKQREGLFKHNRDYLVRAYPSGLRIRSSNLNPPIFWGAGAQVVALNWQQTDEGMMLNEGMFAGTGGYVLKPPGYRPILSSKPETEVVSRQKLNLSITFFAAQDLPLPLGDTRASGFEPYVKVELHVDGSKAQQLGEHPEDKTDGHEREGEYKERTRTHRGCNVDMGGEKLEFKDIPSLMEELTFVRFTVRDDETLKRDDLAAWACVRLDRLGNGYRFLHLIDLTGKLTKGAILVKIEKTLG